MATFEKYQKKDGSYAWMFQTYLGVNPVTGKQMRTKRRGFNSLKEAKRAEKLLQVDVVEKGPSPVERAKTYKEIYLIWLDTYKETVSESTLNKEKGHMRNHILPKFGKLNIEKIDVLYCQKQVNAWAKVHPDYRKIVISCNQVFKYALRIGAIKSNPMDRIIRPKAIQSKKQQENFINFWDKEQLTKFFHCLEVEYGDREPKITMIFRLLAFTGMRRGEMLALNWSDVSFENGTIQISKGVTRDLDNKMVIGKPKTVNSTRVIDIDDTTVTMLKRWRVTQRKQMLGLGYNTISSPKQLVFTNLDNQLLSVTYPQNRLNHIIDKYNLKRITIHGFRHTFASLAFEGGASVKQVQTQLGHADVATTLNIYTHVSKHSKQDTINKFVNFVNL